ncbi:MULTISPECIES: nucleosidase [unclassified Nocardioides]|uniref:nucleosidase n=1 Tax=unclassified Nocardioides TaxID=2615069 RepID=UPI0006F77B51|nr:MULTISPECIES: nucleosidase [unclassified Nocardioides]KRA28174.1 nucleosidase [Nocardioides sp. Root614]KRA86148.1 nucleosidase [Nocardioides sp. Root682]
MPRPLIVAATAAEAVHVPAGFEVLVTGLGKTAAATSLARHLAGRSDLADLVLVNIGTAGALHDVFDDNIDGLFEIGTVLNHDINADAIRALGYDPRERIVVGDNPTVLATGDVFVTDPVVRVRLAKQAHLVDMEGYAYAYAAQEFGVPIQIIKHVSDNADETALEWVAMVDRSARALGAWVAAHLS